ncbi:MAG: right-handed parallel beta-helix repeat-containing protein [Phycisphaerae bacterium]|nr:right-handed parallel beta-helix repeat-containing protein [Phycisphaerae bacterium]
MKMFSPNVRRLGAWSLAACTVGLAISGSASAAVRYVNVGLTTGANNGTSWADAYRGAGSLQTALVASVAGDEIWVAAGTNTPNPSARTNAFVLKTGVAVYGGFAGTESALAQRDWNANVTILSGDLLGNDNGTSGSLSDNAYHVIVGTAASNTAVLDGFTVRAGNANGATASNYDKGGGIIVAGSGNPTVRNCIFRESVCTFGGGAGYVLNAGATFADCKFISNFGASYGGAFDTNNGVTKFERCLFQSNSAARAGAVESFGGANTTYINCIFTGNTATGSNGGGALWMSASTVTARNCTFYGNSATTLAGCIRNTGGTTTLGNCILWANNGPGGMVVANQISNSGGTTVATYSVVQGTYTGTGNTATDPLVTNAAGLDFTLQATSPCIDAGSNSQVPAGTTTDYAGLPRFVDDTNVVDSGSGTAPMVDRGAHERSAPPPPACPPDLNSDGSVTGADLGIFLSSWGLGGATDFNGDGFTDGADLGELLVAWGVCP